MGSNLLDGRLEEILGAVFEDADEPVYVVNPGAAAIRDVVDAAGDVRSPPTVRLLAEAGLLRDVMDDFVVASETADLVADGVLSLRTVADPPANSLVVTADSVVALVDAGGRAGGLETDDDAFVAGAHDAYGRAWETAERYALRTPPRSRVHETMAEELGADVEAAFSRVLASVETVGGDGLDAVTVALLVAAKNRKLFYDVSRWGEGVGVASKATFSRVKNDLEEAGLVETEKVPVDVGRPRQRLVVADDRLEAADGARLADVAESALA